MLIKKENIGISFLAHLQTTIDPISSAESCCFRLFLFTNKNGKANELV